jgi:hypothetical protein
MKRVRIEIEVDAVELAESPGWPVTCVAAVLADALRTYRPLGWRIERVNGVVQGSDNDDQAVRDVG